MYHDIVSPSPAVKFIVKSTLKAKQLAEILPFVLYIISSSSLLLIPKHFILNPSIYLVITRNKISVCASSKFRQSCVSLLPSSSYFPATCHIWPWIEGTWCKPNSLVRQMIFSLFDISRLCSCSQDFRLHGNCMCWVLQEAVFSTWMAKLTTELCVCSDWSFNRWVLIRTYKLDLQITMENCSISLLFLPV